MSPADKDPFGDHLNVVLNERDAARVYPPSETTPTTLRDREPERFAPDFDGHMLPAEDGRWVRYEALEQAATEARRELLAKVEGLPATWTGNGLWLNRAAVLRLIEEPSGWDAAMQDPAFVAALDEGMADVAAGRVSPYSPDRPVEWQGHDHALETFGGHPVPLPFPDCAKCIEEKS